MKMLYRLRVQALTGKLVVQKRKWGTSNLIPQAEGVYPWLDCTRDDLDEISVHQVAVVWAKSGHAPLDVEERPEPLRRQQ